MFDDISREQVAREYKNVFFALLFLPLSYFCHLYPFYTQTHNFLIYSFI